MPDHRPRLLTIRAAAESLNCHPETIRRAIKAGRLACFRLGGCIRIAPEHLAAYLESALCPASAPNSAASNGGAENGTSPGEKVQIAEEFRRERQIAKALDNPSRTSRLNLKAVP